MKVTVITSCTAKKAVTHPRQLTMADFARGTSHIVQRERDLAEVAMAAEDLYVGEQHRRLMQGVCALRRAGGDVSVWIVSAGYGVIPGSRRICPYEASFEELGTRQAQAWATHLGVGDALAALLRQPADLGLVLLGSRYARAARFDRVQELSYPVVAFAGKEGAQLFPPGFDLYPIAQEDTRRFGVNMIGLKGMLAGSILANLPLYQPDRFPAQSKSIN